MPEEEIFYKPINQNESYDRDNLIKHYEDFQDINQYLQAIKEDPENTGAWGDAGELLRKNPYYYFKSERSPRSDLEDSLSEEYSNLGKYVKNNSSTFYGKIESEDYIELIQKVPLCKTGDEEHDEFVDTINEYRKLNEMGNDPNKMNTYVQEKIRKAPRWAQISFARYGKNDLNTNFESYLINIDSKLKSKMYEEDGKTIKSKFLEKVFKDSLDETEKALDDEDYSDSEKNDVWERNVRPFYFALLEGMYKREKKDEDEPQRKKDRDERRKERREKGMPF